MYFLFSIFFYYNIYEKKKKIKLSNLEDFLFDSYNDIIEINNKNNVILNNIKQIKQQEDTSLFVQIF